MKLLTINGLSEYKMPIIGLGSPQSTPQAVEEAVLIALDCGYRLIDTAFAYDNEEPIGAAIKKWINSGKGKRENLFVTTKLPIYGNRAADVEKFLKMSLNNLQLDYVDLYLLHTPFSIVTDDWNVKSLIMGKTNFIFDKSDNLQTWMTMEKQVQNGLTKAIGVSNFNISQLTNIYNNSKIKPTVLQIELHVYLQQKEVVQFCKERNIAVTAYSPLGRPESKVPFISKCILMNDVPTHFSHPAVIDIASKYNKTSAQVLLKHLVQQDIIVIPRSSNPQRLQENLNIFDFELSPDDMRKLDDLDQGENGRSIDFTFLKGVEQHSEYPFKKSNKVAE